MKSLKKVMLAGLGAVSLSQDRAKKVVEELVKQGELKEKEGRQVIDALMQRAETVRRDAEKGVQAQVETTMKKLNLASLDQLKKMEKRVRDLEKELAKQGGRSKQAKSGGSSKRRTKRSTSR